MVAVRRTVNRVPAPRRGRDVSNAPPDRTAHQCRPRAGAVTTPTSVRPEISSATWRLDQKAEAKTSALSSVVPGSGRPAGIGQDMAGYSRPMTALNRCDLARRDLMTQYHDKECAVATRDARRHFEFLVLEGAQAGLSWEIVLRKREGYRRAFARFDPKKVARFDDARVEALLGDAAIIRNRLKIRSAILNARLFLDIHLHL